MMNFNDAFIESAAKIGLLEVGASEEEIDEIMTDKSNLRAMLTWSSHRLWARVRLAQLRARHAEQEMESGR
jgi:hypothetical protein